MKKYLVLGFALLLGLNAEAATITRGETFTANDTVTNERLHDLADDASIANIEQSDIKANYGLAIRSSTQPSDTDTIWVDTSNNCAKAYVSGSYEEIGSTPATVTTGALSASTGTFSSTLAVTGAATFTGNITANGSLTLDDNLYVSDEVTVTGVLYTTDIKMNDDEVSVVKTGTYAGSGAASKAITGVGFEPKYVSVLVHDNAAAAVFFKTDTMPTTYSADYAHYTNDNIRSLDADGFTVGDATGGGQSLNTNGTTYSYIAMTW